MIFNVTKLYKNVRLFMLTCQFDAHMRHTCFVLLTHNLKCVINAGVIYLGTCNTNVRFVVAFKNISLHFYFAQV